MTTATPTPFIESVKDATSHRKVWVFCKSGTMPLEWPKLADGTRAVDDADVTVTSSGKVFRTNQRSYRNIETSITDERGVGAQSAGFMELDLGDTTHPVETDAEFLARIEDWIEKSNDPRIVTYGVRIEASNPYPMPFDGWDTMKTDTILDFVAQQLGDDHDANTERLKRYASYEMSRDIKIHGEPRADILDGLSILADASGDESDDQIPVDESALD